MGVFDLFKKKYNIKPKDNEPRFVYGVPDPTKYDIEPKNNVPEKVYGVKRPKEDLNIKNCPKCGQRLKKYLYGLPASDVDKSLYILGGCEVSPNNPIYHCGNCNVDYDGKLNLMTETFDNVLKDEIGLDFFWIETFKKYFNENVNPKDEGIFIDLIRELAKDKEILNEFSKYIINKNYEIENAIDINGVTAKQLSEKNPSKNAVEIYIELYRIKNNFIKE